MCPAESFDASWAYLAFFCNGPTRRSLSALRRRGRYVLAASDGCYLRSQICVDAPKSSVRMADELHLFKWGERESPIV